VVHGGAFRPGELGVAVSDAGRQSKAFIVPAAFART
jgi:hypothetical protein